jgi:hypothetical protein
MRVPIIFLDLAATLPINRREANVTGQRLQLHYWRMGDAIYIMPHHRLYTAVLISGN